MAFNIKRLLSVFLIFIVLIFSFIILVLYKGQQTQQVIPQHKQFLIYQKAYKKLVKNINSKEKVILVGDREDGITSFVNFYTNKSKGSHEIKRRQFNPEITLEFNMAPLMSNIYHFLINNLPIEKDSSSNNTKLWILQNYQQNTTDFGVQVSELLSKYPNDKFLIVTSQQNLKIPKFKKIQFPQLSQQRINSLFTLLNVNQNIRDNILQFYNNDLQKVFSLLNSEDIQKQFKSQFVQEQTDLQNLISNSTASVKISNILYNLCLNGLYKQKKALKQLNPNNGIISYVDKTYFWAKRQYIYTYSVFIANQICVEPEVIVTVPQQVKVEENETKPKDNPQTQQKQGANEQKKSSKKKK